MNNEVENIRHLAETDYLTGLANRRGLYSFYENLPGDWMIHAMFIDVDNFKRVNDVYGHSAGDELLKCIADLIDKNTGGLVSRIGGDEFVIIMDADLNEKDLADMAQRIIDSVHDLNYRKDILSVVSLSVGIVLNQSTDMSIDDILAKCDAAMYKAKFSGKNCYTVYQQHDREVEIKKSIDHEMEPALQQGQFKVYFQPKINMITSTIYGAEALSRWVHPEDGVRMPGQYIGYFERNGFIAKLDMYIFEETCRIKAGWAGERYEHIPVSVNMSRLHLYDKLFPEKLEIIAKKYNVPANELELEITESVFIKDPKELIDTVNQLQAKGFLVSIDDFGSGFSALNLLKDIPVNTIKLDKEFLKLSSNDIRGKKVIKNVIAMCKDLKLDIVSEGVESKEQIDFLTSCGCKIAQGFYYAKALPQKEFEAFALEYSLNPQDSFYFKLDGNLRADSGDEDASFSHDTLTYAPGIFQKSKAVHFHGGDLETNTVVIPEKCLISDSYTVSMWIKPQQNQAWSSALYVKYESGFFSMIPYDNTGQSDFRIRDSREVDGWYDVTGCQLQEGRWAHYVVSYNEKSETSIAYINGDVVGHRSNVPTNHFVKRIILGGDVFQPTFIGDICEVLIFNETKDSDFVKELHAKYTSRPDFIAFK